ncbi:MAG: heme ABC transporter permease CcmB [Thermoanaerobaculia bacterium]|nr:MAG: heme ABC transporter permease CcmB [Thermoanaerobaculia bacterium]MBZ0101611.1 heme exporter protein CcmB [Thermoanaerobaculia bacterium]
MSSTWLAEALAVFGKDWRSEMRARHSVATLVLFALTTLIIASLALGPIGASPGERSEVVAALLWILLLFAAAAGLPRAFVHEEESRTAAALRLAARPSAVFAGKLLWVISLLAALEAIATPLAVALFDLEVASPAVLLAALAAGGLGLAAATTVLAAIVAQGRGATTLFAALAFPLLVPLAVLAVAATRSALLGGEAGPVLVQLLLYDGSIVVAGFLLFPVIWNP